MSSSGSTIWFYAVVSIILPTTLHAQFTDHRSPLRSPKLPQSPHTNTWAVIVSTSRYWFNYRHTANALSLYRTVKRLGLTDDRILLMLSDDVACNPRNPYPGQVFNFPDHATDLNSPHIEVDYRGFDVTAETFLRLLTGHHSPGIPTSKRLLTDAGSNVLVYLTGHGGDGFLKFSDSEQMSAQDLADALAQMHRKRRYRELLFLADTCDAASLHAEFHSPGLLAMASAKAGQNSYSLVHDTQIGVPIIDRFTAHVLAFLNRVNHSSPATLQHLFHSLDPATISSDPVLRADLFPRPLEKVRVTEFFGEQIPMHVTPEIRGAGRLPILEDVLTPPAPASPPTARPSARPPTAPPLNFVSLWGALLALGLTAIGAFLLV
jgi:phosphatidylinositol glycan class K